MTTFLQKEVRSLRKKGINLEPGKGETFRTKQEGLKWSNTSLFWMKPISVARKPMRLPKKGSIADEEGVHTPFQRGRHCQGSKSGCDSRSLSEAKPGGPRKDNLEKNREQAQRRFAGLEDVSFARVCFSGNTRMTSMREEGIRKRRRKERSY